MVDRAAGKAGGLGLGFNGGELLALAIGGCLCNDLRYVAHEMNVELATIRVSVTLSLEGAPLLATEADVLVEVTCLDPAADVATVVERAKAGSTVSNSIARGFPVRVLSG